jgi:hypothetical protein
LHFSNQFVVAGEQQGGVNKTILYKSADIFALVQATCQHMQFNMLA